MANLIKWSLGRMPKLSDQEERPRLLVIYDFSSQPLSVGDILIFQESSLVLRESHQLGKIDFALVYDPLQPVVPDPAFAHLDAESFLYYLSSYLPVAQVNPYLGSIFLFDSHKALESYITDNIDRYYVWPKLGQYAKREYLFYFCFEHLFSDYFHKRGTLPALSCRPAARAWAREFIERYVGPDALVTVQLRRNPANPGRDSNYESWIAFFTHCIARYPVKFTVICAHSEIDERLRALENVIVAKDYGTSVEQDLALIEAAHMHMGASSGPGTMAQFSRKPYCLFNSLMDNNFVKGFTREGNHGRFAFSGPLQTWIVGEETPELLSAEFQRMWSAVKATLPRIAERG